MPESIEIMLGGKNIHLSLYSSDHRNSTSSRDKTHGVTSNFSFQNKLCNQGDSTYIYTIIVRLVLHAIATVHTAFTIIALTGTCPL